MRISDLVIIIWIGIDARRPQEILLRRRRRRLPFEAGRLPRIVRRPRAEFQRPGEIDERKQVGDRENQRAEAGDDVPGLKHLRIEVIAARHSLQPITNCGRNVTLKPRNIVIAANCAQNSW